MMKRIIALLLALILTVGLLPTVALAAVGETPAAGTSDVKDGYYDSNKEWVEGELTQNLPDGVEKVSKTAARTADNTYEVTLKVVLKQTEQSSGKAATVLVLDTSGSMAYCAECGKKEDCEHSYEAFDGQVEQNRNYYYKNDKGEYEKANYCDGNHTNPNKKHAAGWFKTNWYETGHNRQGDALLAKDLYIKKTRASRLDAAKVAAENFLKTYSGLTFNTDGTVAVNQNSRNLGRYVSVVSFADKAKSVQSWVDVSNSDVYQGVLRNIKGLSAEGGTNLDAGLTYAEYLLNDNTVRGAVKNVIALTDGQPTYCLKKNCTDLLHHLFNDELTIGNTRYCVHGSGKKCTDEIYNSTVATATRVKNVPSKLYTVCFDAGETIDVPNNGGQISVSKYLSTKIATQPTKTGEQFAYDADNAEQLYAEFAKITQSIVSGLSTGTVKDTLPAGITSEAFGEDNVKEWKLNEKPFTKNETPNTVGGKQVTTYTYTYTYTVKIDPDDKDLVTTEDGYAPLNGETTLTVEVDGKKETIPFPIPAGKVTMPSYTVTWKSQDGNTTLETDNNVEYNTQPSFDRADPTKADDAQYTYTFVGWATEANKETGTLEEDLPPVTDDVTYYAAFSKTARTYTVTWMPQDGLGNAYETDTGVAYNARPSYDGTEPTKAADAEHTYTFVGWATTPNQTSGSAVVDLPNVTADVTYYAAFSATKQTYTIRFETEAGGTLTGTTECTGLSHGADFPAAPTTTSNVGYYFDGWYKDNTKVTSFPTTVTENATYTAKWLSYNSINLDLTGKIQKTLNSDVALTNEIFTINLTLNGAEVPSATATATVSATTASGTGYTGSAPFQTATDEFKLTFTAPGTYIYSIVEEAPTRSGMTYDVNKYNATGHTMTVVVKEDAAHALSVTRVTVDGTADTDATWLTITNTYTEPTYAVEKSVINDDASDNIPDSLDRDIYQYPTNGKFIVEKTYTDDTITFLYVIEVSGKNGAEMTIQEKDGGKFISVDYSTETRATINPNAAQDTYTVKLTADVDASDPIKLYAEKTFHKDADGKFPTTATNALLVNGKDGPKDNTTIEERGTLTVDFGALVHKHLTVTGDKSFNGATFTVNFTEGLYAPLAVNNSIEVYADAGVGKEKLPDLTASVTYTADERNRGLKDFDGADLTINTEGNYSYIVSEQIPAGATGYDTKKYVVGIVVVPDGDGLKVEHVWYHELVEDLATHPEIIPGGPTFHNTIDTGKDDYYPIIIPTIINKDTGMLNKTDHFAYVIGYPDGTVHPNGQITRAEVATIFFRLLRDEVRDGAFTTSNSYSDVAYGKWYNNPISTMSALGIITGYPDGTFKPNKPITRAEFAAIAARFDETQSGKSATFSDVIGHWAAREIGIAYYNDWIKGYPDGTFKPDQNITRAEAMTLINRVLERKPESPADLLTNMNKWTDNMDTSKWYYLDVQEATNSHGYTRKTFNYELWRQMLPDPDWSRYER